MKYTIDGQMTVIFFKTFAVILLELVSTYILQALFSSFISQHNYGEKAQVLIPLSC